MKSLIVTLLALSALAALAATEKHRPRPFGQAEEYEGTKDGGKILASSRVSREKILEEITESKRDLLYDLSERTFLTTVREKENERKTRAGESASLPPEEKYLFKNAEGLRRRLDRLEIIALTDGSCPNSENHPRDGSSHTGRTNQICISLPGLEEKLSRESLTMEARRIVLHETTHKLAGKSEEIANYAEKYTSGDRLTTMLESFQRDLKTLTDAEIPRLRSKLTAEGRQERNGLLSAAHAMSYPLIDGRNLFGREEAWKSGEARRGRYFDFPLERLRARALDVAHGIYFKACLEAKALPSSGSVAGYANLEIGQAKCKEEYGKLLAAKKVSEISSDADYERELKKLEKLVAELKAEAQRVMEQKFTVRKMTRAEFDKEQGKLHEAHEEKKAAVTKEAPAEAPTSETPAE